MQMFWKDLVSLTKSIVQMRKLKKIQDYISQCIRLADKNGLFHPSLNLHLATTVPFFK